MDKPTKRTCDLRLDSGPKRKWKEAVSCLLFALTTQDTTGRLRGPDGGPVSPHQCPNLDGLAMPMRGGIYSQFRATGHHVCKSLLNGSEKPVYT